MNYKEYVLKLHIQSPNAKDHEKPDTSHFNFCQYFWL